MNKDLTKIETLRTKVTTIPIQQPEHFPSDNVVKYNLPQFSDFSTYLCNSYMNVPQQYSCIMWKQYKCYLCMVAMYECTFNTHATFLLSFSVQQH